MKGGVIPRQKIPNSKMLFFDQFLRKNKLAKPVVHNPIKPLSADNKMEDDMEDDISGRFGKLTMKAQSAPQPKKATASAPQPKKATASAISKRPQLKPNSAQVRPQKMKVDKPAKTTDDMLSGLLSSFSVSQSSKKKQRSAISKTKRRIDQERREQVEQNYVNSGVRRSSRSRNQPSKLRPSTTGKSHKSK
jgi:hypothetical protein